MLNTAKHNQTDGLPTWPFYSADEIAAASNILQSGKVNYWTGQEGRLFEEEYAKAFGVKYAVALMNGTVALEAAFHALGIGKGDEVITTSRTFIASASSFILQGATPVFADVHPDSQNITAETIEKVITPRTKAILTVHLAGWPCEMNPILALAKKYHLYVIEDCAQAHGAMIDHRKVGSFGDIAAFSFCQDKIITTGGEGGMVLTPHEALFKKMWAYKDHGKSYDRVHQSHPPGFRWLHESFGTNGRMTEMQAAIGRLQLKKLSTWLSLRQRNASILQNALSNIPALRSIPPSNSIYHAYYKYYVFVRPQHLKKDWSRDRLMLAIQSRGVPCFTGSCSEIYKEKAFTTLNKGVYHALPVAKQLGETSLMFEVHPMLTEAHINTMGTIIRQAALDASL